MNITAQQYNSVVSGLQTQLNLQRDMTREKIELVTSTLDRLRQSEAAMASTQRALSASIQMIDAAVADRNAQISAVICACSCGEAPPVSPLDRAWSDALPQVVELRRERDDALAQVAACKQRSRKARK
jgi:hypothetical protein